MSQPSGAPGKMEADDTLLNAEDIMKIVMNLQEKMIKQRTLWDMRLVTTIKKYEEKLRYMENRLSDNQ